MKAVQTALRASVLALAMSAALAAEQDTAARLNEMRAMQAAPDEKAAAEQRRQLDNIWRYFGDNKASALPVLRSQLAAELRKAKPNQLMLLDVGYFLRAQGEPSDKALSTQALLAIDPESSAIAAQSQQLFRFAHAAAQDKDARLLPLIDRAFLRKSVTVFVPQHGYTVDETSVCIYLYGPFGAVAERHLRGLLRDEAVAKRVLEILMWVGSPESVPSVSALLASDDADIFARAATFMLRAGGVEGRAELEKLDPRKLQGKQRDLALELRAQARAATFEALADQLRESPQAGAAQRRQPRLDEASARAALADIYANYGRYQDVQPADLVQSMLPKEQLMEELLRIRERSYLRVSGEALADIDLTNTLINTLRYRDR
ncbi:hypothetical protein [Massilia endophytica]|uniref:hypothetical protein n=1 Tax=Massilia endophytica TaxID=2899220 RepID=UPI001E346C98|nr:hypothetical protein [Massilia endophytica]UGQ48842.1 hypothetical protein LSQ66_10385 [Massilia endophytica]